MSRYSRLLLVLLSIVLSSSSPCLGEDKASSLEWDFAALMDRWTRFKWSSSFLVYALYYHPDMVDPWVELEASRRGMSVAEKSLYRSGFVRDLRFADASAFLVVVDNFSGRDLKLNPQSDLTLVVGGRELKPLEVDRTLLSPIRGKVQGIVFFPKVEDPSSMDLRIAGLKVGDKEVVLSWRSEGDERTPQLPEKIVVVEVPPPPKQPLSPGGTASKETPPPPPKKPKGEDSQGEAGPPSWIGPMSGGTSDRPQEQPKEPVPPKLPSLPSVDVAAPEVSRDLVAEIPRQLLEEAARSFVEMWRKGDYKGMFGMLSSDSRRNMGLREFEELIKGELMSSAIKDGGTFKIQGNRVVVEASDKFLFVRVLRRKVLEAVLEGKEVKFRWS